MYKNVNSGYKIMSLSISASKKLPTNKHPDVRTGENEEDDNAERSAMAAGRCERSARALASAHIDIILGTTNRLHIVLFLQLLKL